MSQKTQKEQHIYVKNPLFLTVLAYLHCCPAFQNPIFSSSTHHRGLAGIVKCCGLEDSGFISFLDLAHYGHQSKWCEMLLCEVGFATKHEYRTLPFPPSPHQAPLEVPTETATLPESDLLPTGEKSSADLKFREEKSQRKTPKKLHCAAI